MRVLFATAVLLSIASIAASQQSRGVVSNLTTEPDVAVGTVRFIVRGTNPCGAVRLNYGDGTSAVTHAIRELPFSYTYEYTRTGDFAVSAEGMGNCDGVATSRARVTLVRPQPPPPPPPPPTPDPPRPEPRPVIRFAAMDRNRDGSVSREEWTGSVRSFSVHDWNRDGRLAGDEVRFGAALPPPAIGRRQGSGKGQEGQGSDWPDWSASQFRQLDRNRDNRLARGEWPFDIEDFVRVDRNGDNLLTMNEYEISDIDDDRGDHFVDLDLNRNNRVERSEWHGSAEAFRWLDRNGDGAISQQEMTGVAERGGGQGGTPAQGGQGRGQGGATSGVGGGTGKGRAAGAETIVVSSREAWTDTGLNVEQGDVLTIRASGTIQFSSSGRDVAEANGAAGRAATANAPLPRTEIGALLGRIGNANPFVVGASLDSFRVPRAGRLYLGVNDDVLRDNRGEFRVTVSVFRGPDR